MGKYKVLARNTAIISAGTLLSKLTVFLMVRFYTGILTPSEYGTADLLITAVGLLMPFVSFGISEGVFRFRSEYQKASKSIFSTGIYTVAVGTALLSLIFLVLYFIKGEWGYLPLLGFAVAAACCHSVCEQYVRACGDTKLFAVQGLLNTLFAVLLNILFLKALGLGITGYVLSVGVADFLCAAYLILKKRLWRCLTRRPQQRLIKKMLFYSIPMMPTTVFWWITAVSDRYMLTLIRGSEANGIYTVANKLPTVLTLVSGVLMQAWQYSAVSESKSSEREQSEFYGNVWLVLLTVLSAVSGIMTALAKTEIRLLADPSYFEAWKYVPILCAAMLFCSFTSFMGSVYTVTKKSSLSFWTSLLGAAINIALNALLIPSPLGIGGAALATFASYFVVFFVRAKNARKLLTFPLFGRSLALIISVLTVQILFITFEWRGWQAVQTAAVIILLIFGRKQIKNTVRCSVLQRTADNRKTGNN